MRSPAIRLLGAAAFVPFSLQGPVLPAEKWPQEARVRVGEGSCSKGKVFRARAARDDEERARGLSRRAEPLGPSEGMLFVWDAPVPNAFWMKDTWIPLTILFFGGDGKLLSAQEMAVEPQPAAPTRFYQAPQPHALALEIAPGQAERYRSRPSSIMLCIESSILAR
jgi:uncharacterized membrane protein (UPF0127 family)